MVCGMALIALATAVTPYLGGNSILDGLLSDPLYIGLSAANLLLSLLMLLKFTLPGWEPHRKTLGWLLGGSLACSLGLALYTVVRAFYIGVSAAGGFDDPVMAGIMRVSTIVGGVIGGLVGMAMSPQFILLLGLRAKKSTEKVAGVVSAVSLGWTVLAVPLGMLAGSLASGAMELPETLWSSTVPSIVSLVCAVVFYFSWPVLDRAVLEK